MSFQLYRMEHSVDISVVIPALNEEKFLPACLDSLARQHFTGAFEVIVVDNNSDDHTADIARNNGARVVTEYRKGICFARERGTRAAKGKMIISTDADCVFPQNWLAQYQRVFSERAGLVAACGPYEFTPIPKWGRTYSRLLFKAVHYFYNRNGKIVYVGASNFAFRKETWLRIGGYNTKLAQGGDEYDLLKRIRPFGGVAYIHKNTVVTSSRRLKRGLLYSVFITLFCYYILDYIIATFFIGRSFFGQYPAYREFAPKRKFRVRVIRSFIYVGIVIILLFITPNFSAKEAHSKTRAIAMTKKISRVVQSKAEKMIIAQPFKYLPQFTDQRAP